MRRIIRSTWRAQPRHFSMRLLPFMHALLSTCLCRANFSLSIKCMKYGWAGRGDEAQRSNCSGNYCLGRPASGKLQNSSFFKTAMFACMWSMLGMLYLPRRMGRYVIVAAKGTPCCLLSLHFPHNFTQCPLVPVEHLGSAEAPRVSGQGRE